MVTSWNGSASVDTLHPKRNRSNGAGCYDPGIEAEGARDVLMEKIAQIAERMRQAERPEGDPPPAA